MLLTARALSLILLPIIVLSCAPSRVNMSDPVFFNEMTTSIVMVKRIEYDNHGRPLFRSVIQKRPDKTGEQFTLVYFRGDKPVKSFDIAVVGRRPDIVRPLGVIYDWTGKGFKVGFELAIESMRGVDANDKYAWVIPAASLVVGTAAGFVIGVGASVPVAIQEVNALITDNEVLISFSEYAYDERGRMKSMRIFQPDEKPRELVKTEFNYHGNEPAPFETVVFSYPEDKTRTVQ